MPMPLVGCGSMLRCRFVASRPPVKCFLPDGPAVGTRQLGAATTELSWQVVFGSLVSSLIFRRTSYPLPLLPA